MPCQRVRKGLRKARAPAGTCGIWLALHLQVDGGQAELVALLQCRLLLVAPHGAAHAEAAPHCGHLLVELLPCDLVVKAQPTELDLHPGGHRKCLSVPPGPSLGWGWGQTAHLLTSSPCPLALGRAPEAS